ncbi:MAG: hypothetical protein DDT23_00140 [candidate division WS2 bacterium]|nr:hypothetical protein [Candidatus Lithacetigena glycinireducens]
MWFLYVVLGVGLLGVYLYNRLIVLKMRVNNSWRQIDVQLKRRVDLIPNLIETVKGYASHEKELFAKVTELRSIIAGGGSVKEISEANNMLTGALKSLFAVAEAYPALKANQNFLMLQEELSGTENKIAFARQFYNDTVMISAVQVFPNNMVATIFSFKEAEYFAIPEEEGEVTKVSF